MPSHRRVENYTVPSLVLGLINLLWIFGVIWVNWGLGGVVLAGLGLNHLIGRLEQHLIRREADTLFL